MDRARRSAYGAVAAALLLIGLLVMAIISGRDAEPPEPAPATFDEASGRCIGEPGPSLQECEGRLAQVESTLKNAATAQESYAVSNNGSYTNQVTDLEAQGLQVPPEIELAVFISPAESYCIEALSEELGGVLHYSSTEGTPRPGPC